MIKLGAGNAAISAANRIQLPAAASMYLLNDQECGAANLVWQHGDTRKRANKCPIDDRADE